jgi:hypothetical protein
MNESTLLQLIVHRSDFFVSLRVYAVNVLFRRL